MMALRRRFAGIALGNTEPVRGVFDVSVLAWRFLSTVV